MTELNEQNLSDMLNSAYQNMRSQEFDAALEIVKQILQESPDYYLALRLKGEALECLERYEEALVAYDKAIETNTEDPDVWFYKVALLGVMERYKEAGEVAEEALEKFTEDYRLWNSYSISLATQDRLDESLTAIEKAIELEKGDASLWRVKASLLNYLEMQEEADKAEVEADRIAPDSNIFQQGILCRGCRGEEVTKLQKRLSELGYYDFKADGFYSIKTQEAVDEFQSQNGLSPGPVTPEISQIIFSDIAIPSLLSKREEDTFNLDLYMNDCFAVLMADSQDQMKYQTVKGFQKYGLNFIEATIYLSKCDVDKFPVEKLKSQLKKLQEKGESWIEEVWIIMLSWLKGENVTGDYEEPERRAVLGHNILDKRRELFARLQKQAAIAVLSLPTGHRLLEEKKVVSGLLYDLKRNQILGMVEEQLWAIDLLLLHALLPEKEKKQVITQAQEVLSEVKDTELHYNFLKNLMASYCVEATRQRDDAYELGDSTVDLAQEREEPESVKQKAKQAVSIYQRIIELGGEYGQRVEPLRNLAVAYDLLEDGEGQRKAWKSLRTSSLMDDEGKKIIAYYESNCSFTLNDYDDVISLIRPIYEDLEDKYLSTVTEYQSEEKAYYRATDHLAYSLAKVQDYETAFLYTERSKNIRLRYRQVIQESEDYSHLRYLQTQLKRLEKGLPIDDALQAQLIESGDSIGANVSLATHIWNQIQQEYSKLKHVREHPLLKTPSSKEISNLLKDNEAIVSLQLNSRGTLVFILTKAMGDFSDQCLLIDELTTNSLLEKMVNYKTLDGFLMALGARLDGKLDLKEPLGEIIDYIESSLATKLKPYLEDKGIKQITFIPDGNYHFVPFWALPSLERYETVLTPSLSHYFHYKMRETVPVEKALIVSDPTKNLPLSSLETSSVMKSLDKIGLGYKSLSQDDATESQINSMLPGVQLLHFCGHGRTSWGGMEDSAALLLAPDWNATPFAAKENLVSTIDQISDWRSEGSERVAYISQIGTVLEEVNEKTKTIEKHQLMYSDTGSIEIYYNENGKPFQYANPWTVTDIGLSGSLRQCAFTFLSACSAGLGRSFHYEELSGLPAVLLTSGVSTIIASLWPIKETFSTLFVHQFYKYLAEDILEKGKSDISFLLKRTSQYVRTLTKENVTKLIKEIRKITNEPFLKLRLEAFEKQIKSGEDRPFNHPYYWAAFYISGKTELTWKGGSK